MAGWDYCEAVSRTRFLGCIGSLEHCAYLAQRSLKSLSLCLFDVKPAPIKSTSILEHQVQLPPVTLRPGPRATVLMFSSARRYCQGVNSLTDIQLR